MSIYFTSDLHFNHNKSFMYEPRGFTNSADHDEVIVKNINSIVQPDDDLYVLGDSVLIDPEYETWGYACLASLNCKLHLIIGNHDSPKKVERYMKLPNVVDIQYATIIKKGKYTFYLSHYPTKVGNFDDEEKHRKFYCLCGHTHTQDKFLDMSIKSYHVELDCQDLKPVSIEQIINDIKMYVNGGE